MRTFFKIRQPLGSSVESRDVWNELPLHFKSKVCLRTVRNRLREKGYVMDEKHTGDDMGDEWRKHRDRFCRRHETKSGLMWANSLQGVETSDSSRITRSRSSVATKSRAVPGRSCTRGRSSRQHSRNRGARSSSAVSSNDAPKQRFSGLQLPLVRVWSYPVLCTQRQKIGSRYCENGLRLFSPTPFPASAPTPSC